MKTKLLLITFSFLFSLQTFAQAPNWLWAKAMGGIINDFGTSVAIDASGNVYTTGFFWGTVDFDPDAGTYNLTSAGLFDIFISKLDGSGNFVWAKRMGGGGYDQSYSITIDASGNIYTTGFFEGIADFDPGTGIFNLTAATGDRDIFISKLNASGNFIWAKRMGGGFIYEGNSIAIDAIGNVYSSGSFGGTIDFDPGAATFNLSMVGGFDNIYISKLDASGNFVWAKRIGGMGDSFTNSIALDASANVYTTGYFNDTVDFDPGLGTYNLSDAGIFVSKLDSSGNFVFAKAMGGGGISHGLSIALDISGGGDIYTTGYFQDTVDFDPGPAVFNLSATSAFSPDIFISKLDNAGNFVWAKAIGGTVDDQGLSLALDASGNLYTTGQFYGTVDFDPGTATYNLTATGFYPDIFVSKFDGLGNFVWAKATGEANEDVGKSLALDASGNVYVIGNFNSPSISFGSTVLTNADGSGSNSDICIAKLDGITGIENIENNNDISVFPNPTTGPLSIIIPKHQEQFSGKTAIEIYNVLGEKVCEQKIILEKTEINLSTQPTGIYFVTVRNDNQVRYKQIIIQK